MGDLKLASNRVSKYLIKHKDYNCRYKDIKMVVLHLITHEIQEYVRNQESEFTSALKPLGMDLVEEFEIGSNRGNFTSNRDASSQYA